MPQINPPMPHGTFQYKNITRSCFFVSYRCACGGTVEFSAEEKQRCSHCQQRYEMRVVVSKGKK